MQELIAVLLATIVAMVLGWLWYGPVFGAQWMRLAGLTKKKMGDMKLSQGQAMSIGLLKTFLVFWVLAKVLTWTNGGFEVAMVIWAGFVATTMLEPVLWEGRPFSLWVLHAAYNLLAFAMGTAIIMLL